MISALDAVEHGSGGDAETWARRVASRALPHVPFDNPDTNGGDERPRSATPPVTAAF